jgi:hypothetical protein
MANFVISGDTSGTVTLQAPAVSGTTTLTLPVASGTILTSASTQSQFPANIAGNGPAFSAYQSSGQSITANTIVKVQLQTKSFDTNSNFDNTTNYRFTPTVAGYYFFNGTALWPNNAGTTQNYIAFYKNGSPYSNGAVMCGPYSTNLQVNGSVLVYMNGSTDYMEMWVLLGNTCTLFAGVGYTFFQAFLARAA